MPYTPTNWQTGDVVTSEKLNKIEMELANPSSGEPQVIICHINTENAKGIHMTSLTVQEIFDALENGKAVIFTFDDVESVNYYSGFRINVGTSEGDEYCMLQINGLSYNYIYRGTDYESSYFEEDFD